MSIAGVASAGLRSLTGGRGTPPAIVWIPALVVGAALLLPLIYLVVRTFGAGGDIWDLLFRQRVGTILVRTILLVSTVTVASIILAIPLAWLTTRTDLPLRRAWVVLSALPLVIPSYVAGFVVVAASGPRGMLQQALDGPFGIERLPDIHGFAGALLTLTFLSFPYVVLTRTRCPAPYGSRPGRIFPGPWQRKLDHILIRYAADATPGNRRRWTTGGPVYPL